MNFIPWIVSGLFVAGIVYEMTILYKKNALKIAKKMELKELYKNSSVFLCEEIEDLCYEDKYQIRGDSVGGVIRPGAKMDIGGIICVADAVYCPAIQDKIDGFESRRAKYTRDFKYQERMMSGYRDETPDAEIPAGANGAAIVFRATEGFDLAIITTRLKKENILVIKIQD